MAVQAGATYLERERGGKGVLLGGVPGVKRGRVTIIGGGVVGANACKIAVGLGANVTVLDVNLKTLAYLDDIYAGRISTQYSIRCRSRAPSHESDLVIGAVLIAGARAPRLVTDKMVRDMEAGSVIVDVSIDQGGCVETARPTTHDNPTYLGARRHPLRRGQHARRRTADVDLRADQRHDQVRRSRSPTTASSAPSPRSRTSSAGSIPTRAPCRMAPWPRRSACHTCHSRRNFTVACQVLRVRRNN